MRLAFLISGFIALILGIIGIFVPLLPTTPFILLAAFLFARSSTRMHRWLLDNRHFGPLITQWEKSRSMPRKARRRAFGLIILTFAISITLLTPRLELQLMLAGLGLILLLLLSRIPVTDAS